MTCTDWLDTTAGVSSIDELAPESRRAILDHIQYCRPCRREALQADSSLLFHSLPRLETQQVEIERIRDSVRTLRRAKEVERSTSPGRWVARAAAVAALLFVALLLDPRRPDELSEESPFAGALGVGAGQLELSRSVTSQPAAEPEVDASLDAVAPTEQGSAIEGDDEDDSSTDAGETTDEADL
ncbi:MAG: hypothetical protein P8Y44_07050 [Acidobacteriota bacterium]